MNTCNCDHPRPHKQCYNDKTHIESYVKVVEGGMMLSIDGRTLVQDDDGVISIAGSASAEPGQIARISEDGTTIEWYTPNDAPIDNRTIVKDVNGNLAIVGSGNAIAGQVLMVSSDGEIAWCSPEQTSTDDKTVTKDMDGAIHMVGSDTAVAGQIPRMNEEHSLEWFTPNHDDKMDKNVYDPQDRNTDIFAEIEKVDEKLHGEDGQFLSHQEGSTKWIDAADMQGDWNQEDTEDISYIKNKPDITTPDDALDTLYEFGYVNPIAKTSGVLFTDNSDRIFVL